MTTAICTGCENGGVCVHPEECQCTAEYTGSSCEIRKKIRLSTVCWLSFIGNNTAICSPECLNGTCIRPQECDCDPGYTGSHCSIG